MAKLRYKRKAGDALKKPKVMIRKKVKPRFHFRRSSWLNSLKCFLMADSFMYGPLTATPKRIPGARTIADIAKFKVPTPQTVLKDLKEAFSPPGEPQIAEPAPEEAIVDEVENSSEPNGQVVQSSIVTIHKKTVTSTVIGGQDIGELRSELQLGLHSPMVRSMDVTADTDITEPEEVDGDEEYSHPGNTHTPLDFYEAEKVGNELIERLGGRFSEEFGIHVDVSDAEVERWFLASNLFSRTVPFNVTKHTYKELMAAGVSKVTDTLTIEESKVAEILEAAGFTKYGQRVAHQLQKLAVHLESENWGRVSTYKHTEDPAELTRQLRTLPGVKLSAARSFMRELRGVWKGCSMDFENRTKKAAMHLRLLSSTNPESHPEESLTVFAQEAAIDIRDLEVALFKLGVKHEKDYATCKGGMECEILTSSGRLLSSIP